MGIVYEAFLGLIQAAVSYSDLLGEVQVMPSKRTIKGRYIGLLLLGAVIIARPMPSLGQDKPAAAEKPSNIDLMVQVLLSEKSEPALRRATAQSLLEDPQAHPALVKILQEKEDPSNLQAKIIICQAIARLDSGTYDLGNSIEVVPHSFIETLFQGLLSDNAELSASAAQALVKCQNGVAKRLAKLVTDSTETTTHRLAGISALELICGREPVLILAGLLKDADPQVRGRAGKALSEMLNLPEPLVEEEFLKKVLPQLEKMDKQSFLLWLNERKRQRIHDILQNLEQEQNLSATWQGRYLKGQTAIFNLLTKPEEKLAFLKENLADQQEVILRIWVLERIQEWSKTATARPETITQQLVEMLSGLVADPNAQVRELSALSLGQLDFNQARSTAGILLEQLKKEADPGAQAAQLGALGRFEFVPSAEEALKLLDTSQEAEVISQAVWSLGAICAGEPETITAEQIETITDHLAQSYDRFKTNIKLRTEFIRSMRRISEQEKYQKPALQRFQKILVEALQDSEATIRGQGVYALTKLLKGQVLPLLLKEPLNLLNDPDNTVRFHVITAIENYGGKEQLPLLRQYLGKETDSDVTQQIVGAFVKILSAQSLDDVYSWAGQFDGTEEKEQTLQSEILRVLLEKIAKARTNGNNPDLLKYETLALGQQAQLARQRKQPDQALVWYQKLLDLTLPAKTKDIYREDIVRLSLEYPTEEILKAGQLQLAQLLPGRADLLNQIALACDKLTDNDDEQILQRGKIIAGMVVALAQEKYPTPQAAQEWRKRADETALVLIEKQEKLLADTGKANAEVIELLSRLNPKLKDYPKPEAPLQQRQGALQEFRKLLQVSPAAPAASQPKPAKTPAAPAANGK